MYISMHIRYNNSYKDIRIPEFSIFPELKHNDTQLAA
jgi:hypothetical protein